MDSLTVDYQRIKAGIHSRFSLDLHCVDPFIDRCETQSSCLRKLKAYFPMTLELI